MSQPTLRFTPTPQRKSEIVKQIAAERGLPVIDVRLSEPLDRLEAKADLFFYERSFD